MLPLGLAGSDLPRADGLAIFAQGIKYSDPEETCCAWMAFPLYLEWPEAEFLLQMTLCAPPF